MAEIKPTKVRSKRKVEQKDKVKNTGVIYGEKKLDIDPCNYPSEESKGIQSDVNANVGSTIQYPALAANMIARVNKDKYQMFEHSLVVNGVKLTEKKESTFVIEEDLNRTGGENQCIKTILSHTRAILGRIHTTKKTIDKNGNITDSILITKMSEEEIIKFEEDWNKYWIPTVSDDQINSAQRPKPSFQSMLEPIDKTKGRRIGQIEGILRKPMDAYILWRYGYPIPCFGLAMLLITFIGIFLGLLFCGIPPYRWITYMMEYFEAASSDDSPKFYFIVY